jgi:hypothetical protein
MVDNTLKAFLEKSILSEFKGEFLLKKDILYKKDFKDGILKGFYFERSSSNKNGFYLWVFAQPLFIPCDSIFLSFGLRLKNFENTEWWDFKPSGSDEAKVFYMNLHDTIIKKGIPYLNQVNTLEMFYQFFKTEKDKAVSIHQGVTYSLFYLGDKKAFDEAHSFLDHIKRTQNCEIRWVKEMINNTELLINNNLDKAREILKEWEKLTIDNLNIYFP